MLLVSVMRAMGLFQQNGKENVLKKETSLAATGTFFPSSSVYGKRLGVKPLFLITNEQESNRSEGIRS